MDNDECIKEVLAELSMQDLGVIHNNAATMVRERNITGPHDITRVWVEAVLTHLLNKADIGWIP